MGEKETATAEERGVVKTKTKSNQSNDRMADDGAGDDGGGSAQSKAAEEKKKDEAQMTGSPPRASQAGMPSYREGAPGDDDPEAAINNTKSNIKNLRETDGGIQHEDDWEGQSAAAGDLDRDGPADARINNTKSNLKSSDPGAQGIAVSDEGTPADKSKTK